MEIGLSLGTNMGNRLVNLSLAKKQILKLPGISYITQSQAYETEPVDVLPEFARLKFLNSILIIETAIPCQQLLLLFQQIEQNLGRVSDTTRNMPRPMDIDIIYADQLSINSSNLKIPHPKWAQRRFVVQPLCDVQPNLHIHGQAGTVSDVLSRLADSSNVSVFATDW